MCYEQRVDHTGDESSRINRLHPKHKESTYDDLDRRRSAQTRGRGWVACPMDAVFPDKLLFHDSTTSPRNIILRALYAPRPRSGASHPLPVVLERRRPLERARSHPALRVRATSRTSPGYTSTMGARVRARRYARMRTCVICTGLWMASGAGTQRCRVAGVGGRRCVVCGGDREVGAGGGCADTSLMLRYCAMAFHAPASSRPKTSLSLPVFRATFRLRIRSATTPSRCIRPAAPALPTVCTTPAPPSRAIVVTPRRLVFFEETAVTAAGAAHRPCARCRRPAIRYRPLRHTRTPSPTSPSPGCGQRGVFDATLRACVVLVEVEMRACPAGWGGSDGPGGGGMQVGEWIDTARIGRAMESRGS
ncbi:hypothetical protein C8R46DRAFT_308618 [Mycena filopes]|nr:hypothetical protein C8R46DRAFT_308618 [Mycena filopes]